MKWEKKICIRITMRRLVGAILIAASSINLIIVGAAVGSASTVEPTVTPSLSHWDQQTTRTVTSTETTTATATIPTSPTPTPCALKTYWPFLYVQRGDTLSALARATGSTVDELMQANCLTDTRILAGQLLYVPRLPIL